jgi:hypothetical protein
MGMRAHKPPLYYIVAAILRRLLHIESFEHQPARATTVAIAPHRPTRSPTLSHNHNHEQRHQAIIVHTLRVLSVLLGLATVLLTYPAARLVSDRQDLAAAAAAFVAFFPKFEAARRRSRTMRSQSRSPFCSFLSRRPRFSDSARSRLGSVRRRGSRGDGSDYEAEHGTAARGRDGRAGHRGQALP